MSRDHDSLFQFMIRSRETTIRICMFFGAKFARLFWPHPFLLILTLPNSKRGQKTQMKELDRLFVGLPLSWTSKSKAKCAARGRLHSSLRPVVVTLIIRQLRKPSACFVVNNRGFER